MIRTVADLLSSITHEKIPQLDAVEVKHGPTIGDMYEGLSSELLAQSLPEGLELNVVTGFAKDRNGNLSHQLDCMLVHGTGESIPYTDSFVWPVEDVIAVIEVKKTLYSAQMAESLDLLRSLGQLESNDKELRAAEAPAEPVSIELARRAFSETTGLVAPPYDQLDSLAVEHQMIFHALINEQHSIIRVALGYHGFQSETAFRKAFVKLLGENIGVQGFSPASLPQLIVSGNYSIVKMNGRPYSAQLVDDQWPFYVSTPVNPMLILLELIWTRLDEQFGLPHLWGDDLDLEVPRKLLTARAATGGWHLSYVEPTEEDLAALPVTEPWSPAFLSREEFLVLQRLCAGRSVSMDDPKLVRFLDGVGTSPDDLRSRLVSTGLVAMDGLQMQLIAVDCLGVILPSGEYVAAENNTGRFSRWLRQRVEPAEAQTETD
ncbi:DUF6602 domain-containing protein [Dactylosporangium cerinum]|uniref:DUF6602 domain-containing protein n=1 Tax=Dactylosporangium cerinum TaxID=1434730 RepID=A0ABV9W2Y3_9ACTN